MIPLFTERISFLFIVNFFSLDASDSSSGDESPVVSDSTVEFVKEEQLEKFRFLPLTDRQRRDLCSRLGVKCRVDTMKHANVGELLNGPPSDIKKVLGDGNCSFRALSVAVTGHETAHMKFRQEAVQHIREAGTYTGIDGDNYLNESNMAEDKEEATDVELMSLAQVIGVDIFVYHKYGKVHKWLKFPCKTGAHDWNNAIYLDNSSGNGKSGHFDYVTGA